MRFVIIIKINAITEKNFIISGVSMYKFPLPSKGTMNEKYLKKPN
jgi:hypothetical protein